ncbi:MAG: hypothetical protein PHN75_04655 [Syntrophales bacterium]|nr:hypothetical protein [Syntrophales bacterium]
MKRRLSASLALVLAVALVASPPAWGAAGPQGGMSELEVGQSGGSGYFKTYGIGIFPKRVEGTPAELQRGTGWQSLNAVRLNGYSRPAENLKVEVGYEFQALWFSGSAARQGGPTGTLASTLSPTPGATYRLVDLNNEITSSTDDRNYMLTQNLDRLAAHWKTGKADVTIGRQAITFGQAKVIQTTDVLLPYSFRQLNVEYRIGVDAVRAQIPISQMGEIDVGVVVGDKAKSDESAAFARLKTTFKETDLVGMAMSFSGARLLGGGLQRGIWLLGYNLDAACVWTDQDDRYFRLSQSLDYSFKSGLTLFTEYHFNGAGTDDPSAYLSRLSNFAYRRGGVFLLGRHYIIPGMTYPITALLNSRLQTMTNLQDGSTFISGSLEYGLSQNVYLDAGFFGALGSSPQQGVAGVALTTEFGSYPNQIYGALRWYF